jgi:transposase
VFWDFEGGGYCCPECGTPFMLLGDHVSEQLDWVVIVPPRQSPTLLTQSIRLTAFRKSELR